MSQRADLWSTGEYADPAATVPWGIETSDLDLGGPDNPECAQGCDAEADCLCSCCNHEGGDRCCSACCAAIGPCSQCAAEGLRSAS
ncbi:MAG: hypothetical protein JWL76_2149 [Thermoleophilia bacterium]|nr:hypothetical protein [Thermoleophilia bacterium]